MSTLPRHVANIIHQRRRQLFMTIAEAAKATGISERVYSEIELGKHHGSAKTIASMTRVLKLPQAALVSMEAEPEDERLAAIARSLIEAIDVLTSGTIKVSRLDLVRSGLAPVVVLARTLVALLEEAEETHADLRRAGLA
jgi:transcriptional regulator with XRE-family HTH domain